MINSIMMPRPGQKIMVICVHCRKTSMVTLPNKNILLKLMKCPHCGKRGLEKDYRFLY